MDSWSCLMGPEPGGCIAIHEHPKMVAKQLQAMFHHDSDDTSCVSLLGLITLIHGLGWTRNKFTNLGRNDGGAPGVGKKCVADMQKNTVELHKKNIIMIIVVAKATNVTYHPNRNL